MVDKTELSPVPQDPALEEPIGLDQRLLAEAIRLHEDAQGRLINEPQADARARQIEGDLESRIIVRAQSLSIASSLMVAFHQLRNAFSLVIAIGLVMAAIAGATAAQVALGTQVNVPVNFFWVLGSILGVQTITLILWLIVITLKPGAIPTSSLGGIAFTVGRRIAQWLHKGPLHIAAFQAMGLVYARTAIGRWTLSAISHAFWLSFLTGCLALVILILSTKHYSFAWETTILSERTYIALTRTIAGLPEILGFMTPDARQIADSHWPQNTESFEESREAWSGLLIGSIIAYGILPRAILLLLCLLIRQRAAVRFRLDMTLPGYRRLQSRLMPTAKSIGVVDPDTAPEVARIEPSKAKEEALQANTQGPVAIMGLEIDPPGSSWPPLNEVEWLDLGFVDSRTERHRALEQITSATVAPRLIVVVCSVAVTPDRGTRSFVSELQRVSHIPVVLALTEGQRLRERGDGERIKQRIEDWRRLAADAQVSAERVIEVDLDHLTEASSNKLAAIVGTHACPVSHARHIEQSFALIVKHVEHWAGEPSVEQQAELHRAIAGLYRGEHQSWQTLLRARVSEGGHKVEQLKTSANRMVALLPERLRGSPRWLAAGAMAGAMGCIAASALVAPAAITALPAWAGLGAAVSAIIHLSGNSTSTDASRSATVDLSGAVSSAALFALLLELQGYDEVTITRIIDRIALEEDLPAIDNAAGTRQWLDTLRHRFDLALIAEAVS
jgi:hypothetical protein